MNELSLEKQVPYYEQFYHMIKKMIFEGKYQPGERINETQLAKEFNVSKSPIREAVRILEKEGLLVVKKSKVVVYEPTLKDVKDIYFCRMALESFAAKITTQMASDEELKEIEDSLLKTEKAIQANENANTIITLNEQFHNLILKFTHNNRLQKQVNDLKGLIYFFRILNFKGENRAADILKQHRSIFECMKNRDAEQASEQMINHLELDTEHLFEVLSSSKDKSTT
ncbi:GntR family transcriptional regulator [Salinibacillus xinjiangensis]|uniref:FCD domain-containing protein n=1 Tax=Salinibacillus xinjiangensis TaxID=1229268 RepID=A0A6G1X1V8_9BACI|nr:GntR family transcriptional regulator [Salinibacillus xinjiangensis]MRG84971.1 FCD domain-containing protein [Salinibacillus xinjiangensis]